MTKKKQQQQPGDPLTAEQARSLLRSTSVIRDPVHGDIRLTMLERLLVDCAVKRQSRLGPVVRMSAAQQGSSPPELLSTHPADATRIRKINELMPEAMEYYGRAQPQY